MEMMSGNRSIGAGYPGGAPATHPQPHMTGSAGAGRDGARRTRVTVSVLTLPNVTVLTQPKRHVDARV